MKTADDLRQEVTKDIHISILKDALADLRMANVLLKQTMRSLLILLTLCILGIVGLSIYHQHRMFDIMENSETVSDVNMTNDKSYNNGSIIIREK